METPYSSSQVSLPPSTSNSTPPSASSSSASSCLASVNPSYDSNSDELRHSRKRTAASEDEVERKEGGSNVEDFEGSGHEGRNARPRAMLRRSRTVQQVERSQIATLRARRASTAMTEQEWSTNAGCEERVRSEEESAEEQHMVKRSKTSANEEEQACEEGIAPLRKSLSPSPSPSFSIVDDTSSFIPPPLVPIPIISKLSTRSSSLPFIEVCSSSTTSNNPPAQPLNSETSCFPTAVSRAPSPQEHSNSSLRHSPTSTALPPRRSRANSLPTLSPSSRSQASSFASTSTSRPMSPRAPEHREQFVKFYDSKEKRARRRRPEPVQASPIPSYRYRNSEQRPSTPRLLSQTDLLQAHSSNLASRGIEVSSPLVSTSLVPPISKNTLRELDLNEVMMNAQLRHDVVFDPNLMFRANMDGEKGERKRIAAEQYWLAVSGEISTGCRCTTFADYTLLPCICTSTSPSSKQSNLIVTTAQLPSRVIALVAELRGILLSLLPAASSVSPILPSTAIFGSTSSPASPTPPSVSSFSTYGPREQIIEALEPVFISRQLVQGILDVAGLARFLGSTLKTHCAPMRDDLVDEMVEACEGDGIIKGLRMCFEILELMKLDIANHQLRSLRPYLLQTSVEFERRFFEGLNARQGSDSTIPRSQSWFDSAASAFEMKVDQLPMDSRGLADKIVAHGVLDLVFSPQTLSSTPPSPRPDLSSFPTLPETLQLDAYRLAHFHSDATDLTIVYMLTLLYQQLALPARPSPQDLDVLRHELWCIIQASTGSHSSLVGASTLNVGIPQGPPGQGIAKLDSEEWRNGMQDALLQVAARAQEVKLRTSSTSPSIHSSTLPTPNQQTLALINGYFDVNARADSKVFQLLSQRLRETLQGVVDEELSKEKARSDFEFVKWWIPASAPTPMRTGSRRTASGNGSIGTDLFTPTASMMASTSPTVTTRGTKRSHSEEEEVDVDNRSVLSDDEGEKRQRTGRSSSLSTRHALTHASQMPSSVDLAFSRNGLTSLAKEVRMLGERIAKVTSFNLSVYRPLYETLLSARRN